MLVYRKVFLLLSVSRPSHHPGFDMIEWEAGLFYHNTVTSASSYVDRGRHKLKNGGVNLERVPSMRKTFIFIAQIAASWQLCGNQPVHGEAVE